VSYSGRIGRPSLGTLAACRPEVLAMALPTPAIRMGDVYRDSPDGTWLAKNS